MKKIEILSLVAVVLYIVSILAWGIFDNHFNIEGHSDKSFANYYLIKSILNNNVLFLAYFAIAIWMFIEARKVKLLPWVWILLSLVFGLLAPILFYVYRIFQIVNSDNENNQK